MYLQNIIINNKNAHIPKGLKKRNSSDKPEKPEKLFQRSKLLNLNIPTFRFLVNYPRFKEFLESKGSTHLQWMILISEIFISTRVLIIYRDEQQIILETTPPPRSGDQFLVIIVNFLKRHL